MNEFKLLMMDAVLPYWVIHAVVPASLLVLLCAAILYI